MTHLARMTPYSSNEIGKTYADLTVLRVRYGIAKCQCACGGTEIVALRRLKNGRVKRCKACEDARKARRVHKKQPVPEYWIWSLIKSRCTSPRSSLYPNYGGRGIKMWEGWYASFDRFMQDVGPRPAPEYTIERIDNEGNYEPGNVKWATRKEQARNRRGNHLVTMYGRTQCIAAWAEENRIDSRAVYSLVSQGYSAEAALIMAPRTNKPWPLQKQRVKHKKNWVKAQVSQLEKE